MEEMKIFEGGYCSQRFQEGVGKSICIALFLDEHGASVKGGCVCGTRDCLIETRKWRRGGLNPRITVIIFIVILG